MNAYVAVHPEWGTFIGHALGLTFWSNLDSVGQVHAATFASPEEARQALAKWDDGVPAGVEFKPVNASYEEERTGWRYATTDDLRAAGLPSWVNENTPHQGAMQ